MPGAVLILLTVLWLLENTRSRQESVAGRVISCWCWHSPYLSAMPISMDFIASEQVSHAVFGALAHAVPDALKIIEFAC